MIRFEGMGLRMMSDVLTLYMLLILIYWAAPWLHLNLYGRYTRLIPRLVEPLVNRVRTFLPPLGPMDFGPLAALFVIWLARACVQMLFPPFALGR